MQFRIKVPDYLKVKAMAAGERRQINAMARELVLRAIEHAEQLQKEKEQPSRAARKSPAEHARG